MRSGPIFLCDSIESLLRHSFAKRSKRGFRITSRYQYQLMPPLPSSKHTLWYSCVPEEGSKGKEGTEGKRLGEGGSKLAPESLSLSTSLLKSLSESIRCILSD